MDQIANMINMIKNAEWQGVNLLLFLILISNKPFGMSFKKKDMFHLFLKNKKKYSNS